MKEKFLLKAFAEKGLGFLVEQAERKLAMHPHCMGS